jgi:hypothetical protein
MKAGPFHAQIRPLRSDAVRRVRSMGVPPMSGVGVPSMNPRIISHVGVANSAPATAPVLSTGGTPMLRCPHGHTTDGGTRGWHARTCLSALSDARVAHDQGPAIAKAGGLEAAAGRMPVSRALCNGMILVATLAMTAALVAGADKPYIVLERGGVRAVIVNNEAVDDEVLPGHRAGYSGVASLTCRGQNRNLFVPAYAGLNFEHIHDGTVQRREVLFEPRNAPMEIRRADEYTAELHQPPTPHWQLESWLRYKMLEDGAIELTLECIPRARTFKNTYIGLFFASYIHQPESLDIHFRGHTADDAGSEARWIRGVTPEHGVRPTHLAFDDYRDFPHEVAFPLSLVFNRSDWRYREPWYYGVSHGLAFVQMFQPRDQVRLSQSPSGGGEGNPAWDFQWFIPQYEVGRRYRFVMRALYLAFESTEQVTKATAEHRAALQEP